MRSWFETHGKKNQNSKRALRLESLEDRMLLAVTAGGEETAASLVAEAEPTGNVIEVTELTRTAINTAITNASSGDTIRFASSLSGKTFTATASVLKVENKDLTFEGNGVIISGSSSLTRAAFVMTDSNVTFQNFTFNSLGACALQGSGSDITVIDCTFTNNRSNFNTSSGASTVYIGGGAVGVLNGNITVDGCSFSKNYGALGGALAVCNLDGSMGKITVTDSVFDTNFCNKSDQEARGGAISAKNADIYVTDSTFIGNYVTGGTKVQGGALYAEGNITVDNSTFTWNDATTDGTRGTGGAIFGNGGTVTISNSLIANNRSYGGGGGIMASGGTLNMYNCTVACNVTAAETTANIWASSGNIYNSVIANGRPNASSASSYDMNLNLPQSSLHDSYVTIDNFGNGEIVFNSLPAYSEELGQFRFANFTNSYWKTQTWDYTLGADSVARNAGDNAYAVTTSGEVIELDLNGAERFVYEVDMGAYEIQKVPGELDRPENLAAEADCTSITVSWDPRENAAGYVVRWQESGSSEIQEAQTTDAFYTITGLNGRRTYQVSVKAVGDGVSTFDSSYAKISAKTLTPVVNAVVTNLNDSGEGSLRSILESLDTISLYKITFADGLSGTIALEYSYVLRNGNLAEIDAAGITFTAADGAEEFAAFKMASSSYEGGLTLKNAVVSGFSGFGFQVSGEMAFTLENCTVEKTAGAIRAESGVDMTITGCAINDNASTVSGGSGIYALHSTLAVSDTQISGNTSCDCGGGVYLVFCTVTMDNCEIAKNALTRPGNTGKGSGGGLFASDSVLTMTGCSVLENTTLLNGAGGGGIWIEGDSQLSVLNSLIAGNKVARSNGSTDGNGGGLYVYTGTAVLSNTQIIGNLTTGYAGAAIVLFGQLSLYNCTVAGNAAQCGVGGILVANTYGGSIGGIYNTIVSGNVSKKGEFSDENISNFDSAFTAVNWTLLGSTLTEGSGAVAKTGLSLSNLVNNFTTPTYAGITQTTYQAWDFIPKSKSALVDAGSNGNALDPFGNELTTDYRGEGFVRINNDIVDVGAYEYQKVLPPIEGVSVVSYTGDYDGEAHGVTVTGTMLGDTVYYSVDGSSWSTKNITYTDPGNYTVFVKVTRSGSRDWTGSGTVTINEVTTTKLSVVVVLSDKAAAITESAEIPSSITTAKVGDTIYAQVWIKNADGSELGCTGGYIDLTYSNTTLTVGSYIASSIYASQASRSDTSTAGRVADFGGCAETGVNDLAVSSWALLGTFTFTASEEGTAQIDSAAPTYHGAPLAALNLSRAGEGNLKTAEIEYNSASLTVTAGGGGQLDAPVISTGKPGIYVSYGANRHQIQWGAVANASGYELAYSADGGSTWKMITVSETNAVVTGLTYEADIIYKVRALGSGAYTDSVYSAAKTFTVCPMDINNDGDIAGADRTLLGNAWLAEEGDENYLPCCDIDGNEEVSGTDRSFLVKNWLCEVGEDELAYPKPLNADSFFEEFASEDLGTDLNIF